MARLRARVDELERELAKRGRQRDRRPLRAEFRDALHEAMLYGLARTLSLYDPKSVSLLVREMGRRIREYLEELGYHIGGGQTIHEVVEETIRFFVAQGFVDLEVVSWENDVIRARWRNLLGLRAYARIVAAGAETFVSCPLNAMLHDSLAAFGKELRVTRKEFKLDEAMVESWEAIVDMPADEGAPPALSLDPDRVLELQREQSRQLRIRDEFIRMASHELSTPLTSAKLALELLGKAEVSDDAAKAIALLRRQLGRLERLVTDMLDTTQLQIGRLRLTRAPADLVEVTRHVIDGLQAVMRRDPSEVGLYGDPVIVGSFDETRLEQALASVIGNALKYGGAHPVTVHATASDGRARLVVRDQGIGISAEAMGRLFSPFERSVSSKHYGGLGLGLFLARRIVQMHGGTLDVESKLGKGTTVTIVLPLEAEGEPEALVERPASAR